MVYIRLHSSYHPTPMHASIQDEEMQKFPCQAKAHCFLMRITNIIEVFYHGRDFAKN